MIKVLWLVGMILPQIADDLGIEMNSASRSWQVKLADEIAKSSDIRLCVVFPQTIKQGLLKGSFNVDESGENNVEYIGFYQDAKPRVSYDQKNEKVFKEIITDIKPDILHIWGTEFSYSLAMINAFDNPDKTVISIQGLMGILADRYYSDLPFSAKYGFTLRDLLRLDNVFFQKYRFRRRARYEKIALEKVGNFIGRTDWDRAATYYYNKSAKYYNCNEILRSGFYENTWDIDTCEKHSVIVSQAGYPIKGIHKVLEAIGQLLDEYPNIMLYVCGNSLFKEGFKGKLKKSYYSKYIETLIRKYNLENHVSFLGVQDEEGMIKCYKRANVYVSASSMENESNSLSEAKMLGMPVIASYAGGTSRRVDDGVDGFQYQYTESYMLAYYIKQTFDDDELAISMGKRARENAQAINDIETNRNRLFEIYGEIEKS